MEELGRGAFGKVHKGVLRVLPSVEVFFKPREERVDFKEDRVVAVKVLLGEQGHSCQNNKCAPFHLNTKRCKICYDFTTRQLCTINGFQSIKSLLLSHLLHFHEIPHPRVL